MQPTEQSKDIITNDIPYIKQVTIKGLFGKKDIDWALGEVNVLVGQNGSGKSTILRLIRDALFMAIDNMNITNLFDSVKISFANTKTIENFGIRSKKLDLSRLQSFDDKTAEQIQETRQMSPEEFLDIFRTGALYTANYLSNDFATRTKKTIDNTLIDQINVEYLSTFDMMLLTKQEIDEISGDKYTQLDVELDKQMNRLAHYQLVLSRQVSKEYKSAAKQLDFQTIEDRVLHRVNQFEQALNNLFNPNDKQFKINDDGAIEVSYLGDKLPLTALSSGEKQLILILLKVVNSSDKPTILLLDEPEVSLHLTWQENLIKTIRAINDQCQLIIVTHSPALVMNGWMDCYTELKDITTDTQ